MNPLVLLLAALVSIPMCLIRRKKYNLSFKQMCLIYLFLFFIGAVGASFGAISENGTLMGKRLYGMMIFDTAGIFVLNRLLKIDTNVLGDFIAAPVLAICSFTKLDCVIKGCCYGFTLYQLEMQQPVRFPSAILEMTIWGIMTILLLVLEHKEKAKDTLWPVSLIWFGTARFLVDFLRGSALEKEILFLGMTNGQFWSLITLLTGIVFLFVVITKKNGRKPKIMEFLKSVIGNSNY